MDSLWVVKTLAVDKIDSQEVAEKDLTVFYTCYKEFWQWFLQSALIHSLRVQQLHSIHFDEDWQRSRLTRLKLHLLLLEREGDAVQWIKFCDRPKKGEACFLGHFFLCLDVDKWKLKVGDLVVAQVFKRKLKLLDSIILFNSQGNVFAVCWLVKELLHASDLRVIKITDGHDLNSLLKGTILLKGSVPLLF